MTWSYPLSTQDSVVRRLISNNPGLNFNPRFFIFFSKASSRIFFSIFFLRSSNYQTWTKRTKMNFLFKLSYLNSNFTLTLGYLNLPFNNPAHGFYIWRKKRPWIFVVSALFLCAEIKLSSSSGKPASTNIAHAFTLSSDNLSRINLLYIYRIWECNHCFFSISLFSPSSLLLFLFSFPFPLLVWFSSLSGAKTYLLVLFHSNGCKFR